MYYMDLKTYISLAYNTIELFMYEFKKQFWIHVIYYTLKTHGSKVNDNTFTGKLMIIKWRHARSALSFRQVLNWNSAKTDVIRRSWLITYNKSYCFPHNYRNLYYLLILHSAVECLGKVYVCDCGVLANCFASLFFKFVTKAF